LRAVYEPFVIAMSNYFLVQLPELNILANRVDDWQTSAWDQFLSASPHTLDRAIRGG
jgi:hypothetical protein